MRTAPYGGVVQAPRNPPYFNPLPELTTLHTWTYNHLFLDRKPNKIIPKVTLPTYAQHPAGTSRAGRQ
jgi:hypothetical protein